MLHLFQCPLLPRIIVHCCQMHNVRQKAKRNINEDSSLLGCHELTWHNKPEHLNLRQHCCENLKILHEALMSQFTCQNYICINSTCHLPHGSQFQHPCNALKCFLNFKALGRSEQLRWCFTRVYDGNKFYLLTAALFNTLCRKQEKIMKKQ